MVEQDDEILDRIGNRFRPHGPCPFALIASAAQRPAHEPFFRLAW
jgi:hypothetical protein